MVTLTALVLGPPPDRVTAACQQGQVPAADFDGGPQAEQRQGRGVVTGVVTRHDRQSRPAHRLGSGPAAPTPAAARRPGRRWVARGSGGWRASRTPLDRPGTW